MSGLVDKLKGVKAISTGSKISSSHALKENNPEQGTVDLSNLPGKSEFFRHINCSGDVMLTAIRHHRWSSRRLHTSMLFASPGLH